MKTFNLNLLSKYRTEIFGFAILWIMLFHGTVCDIKWTSFLRLLNVGNMGVEIFLLLSGIGLYYSFAKNHNLREYAVRRISRVFIPMITISGFYWLYQLSIHEISLIGFLSRILTLNFWISGDQQMWYVSLIVVAYLFYPYIYYLLFSDQRGIIIEGTRTLLLVLISVVITVAIKKLAPTYYAMTEIALTRFPVFIIGCFLGKSVFDERPINVYYVVVLMIFMAVGFYAIANNLLSETSERYMYMIAGIPLTLLLTCVFEVVKWKPLHAFFILLGNMSLELYITHIIIIRLYKKSLWIQYSPGMIGKYIIIIFISICISLIAYKMDTKISRRLRNRLLNSI